VKAAEQEAAKDFAYGCRVDRGQLEELSCPSKDSIGNKHVQVRMKICSERAEALDRNDAPGADVLAAEQGLEALADGVIGRAGKESQEAALSLEQAADGFRDGKGPMSIGHRRKNLAGELLGKQRRAFGLAARAHAARAAAEREKVLALAGREADACEASLETTAGKKLLDTLRHNAAQRS
jgi:hypothetical protein